MRILHIVHQYPPDHIAGTELYTRWLAQCQAAMGHDVVVFTPLNQAKSTSTELSVEDGVRVYRRAMGARNSTTVFLNTFRQTGLVRDFTGVLAAETPDIVHIEHLMGWPTAIGHTLHKFGVPYVIFLHDYWYGCANGQLLTNDTQTICDGPDPRYHNCGRCAVARAGLRDSGQMLAPMVAPLMRRRNESLAEIYAGAARIIAPNEFVRQVYGQMDLNTERMTVIPMGVESPPAEYQHSCKNQTALLKLAYIGSISPQKGVHCLVEAANSLPAEGVSLEIYGDLSVFADYADQLQSYATHPGISFGGRLERARVWEVLAGIDALVFPTLWYEASPFIVREAFAAGVPIIASDIGATATMIRDGIDGLLFPAGDAASLRSIFLRLIDQPDRLAELRRNIVPPPTLAEHAAAIESLYHQVLDEHASASPIRN
jgi:glycosyltransferase involved in cell wall biosynthesis